VSDASVVNRLFDVVQDDQQGVDAERLGDERVGAELGRLRAVAQARAHRDHDHPGSLRGRDHLQLLEEGPAVHHGHHDVEQDDVRVVFADLIQRRPSVGRREGLVPLGLKAELEHRDDLWLVVDDQDPRRGLRSHHRERYRPAFGGEESALRPVCAVPAGLPRPDGSLDMWTTGG